MLHMQAVKHAYLHSVTSLYEALLMTTNKICYNWEPEEINRELQPTALYFEHLM